MIFVSITRLRIRSLRFLPGFALHAIRSQRQCSRAPGFLDGRLLPDRHWTFWTMTAWEDQASMRAYMASGPHRAAMPRLLDWCDEASVVHWEQDNAELPSWTEADHRMRAEGRPSKVRHPSLAHASLTHDAPRVTAGGRIKRVSA